MASSDSSRDGSNNNNKNTNKDNIFVQFRRNVDHQISAVLQSFIGVPSHMRRNERAEDNRWQDIEDDRQRRIEERTQLEQHPAIEQQERTPSPGPTMNRGRSSDDAEYVIPVKTFRPPAQELMEAESKCPHFDYDYDLFAPFGQNEMERLIAACKIERPAHLYILAGVQQRFHASMKDISCGNQLSQMALEKTLMPYLLFSSYSPLRLTHLPPLRRRDMPAMLTFSYAEAFEDLLEISKNDSSPFKDEASIFSAFGVPSLLNEQWALGLGSSFGRPFSRQPMRSPLSAMEWIATSLVEKDIFRENTLYETIETPIGTFRAGQYSTTTEVLLNWLAYKHAYELAITQGRAREVEVAESPFKWPKEEASEKSASEGPRTEQEMYDDFFNTPPAARVKYMDKGEDDEERSPSVDMGKSTTESFGTQTSVLDHAPQSSSPESERHKNPWSWSSIQKPSTSSEERVVLISNVPGSNPTMETSSDGLVSHEVTEESETLPDGTVKTTVITKKKYGNGKSQVTISTSFDKPAEQESESDLERSSDQAGKAGKGVVTKVKEWFWK